MSDSREVGSADPYHAHLFSHAMHEENVFYNRLNFFLLFESVLLGALVTSFGDGGKPPYWLAVSIAVVGLVTSAAWMVVQYDKLVLIRVQMEWLKATFPTFEVLNREASSKRRVNLWATTILAVPIPGAFLIAWAVVCFTMLNL